MPSGLRCLIGPLTPEISPERFGPPSNNRLTLGGEIPFTPSDSWAEIQSRFPQDWSPDFVAYWGGYTDLPRCFLEAPVPLVLLAPDSNLLGHAYAHLSDWFELALTDAPSVSFMKSLEFAEVLEANFFGVSESWFENAPLPQAKREIDVCFVGSLNPPVQRTCLSWLGRLAKLASPHRKVRIAQGIVGDQYRTLLRQAKIVFNLSIRGEFNLRVGEACSSGALLLQETWNTEVPKYLKPGLEYGVYDADNLEEIIESYLSSDAARCSVARRGQEKIREFGAVKLWHLQLNQIQEALPRLQEKAKARSEKALQAHSEKSDPLKEIGKVWLILGANQSPPEITETPFSLTSTLENLVCRAALIGEPKLALAAWERVLQLEPNHPQALVAKTLLLHLNQKPQEAIAHGIKTLDCLTNQVPPLEKWLRQPALFWGFDYLRVGWERILWETRGDLQRETILKLQLLHWQVTELLAQLTHDARFWQMAIQAQPELASTHAGFGCSLAQRKLYIPAIAHLKKATQLDPFDTQAARAYVQALEDIGDHQGSQAFKSRLSKLRSVCPSEAPSGPELEPLPRVSIIVPCYNLWNLTARCLNALWKNTPSNCEIIVVNDGSSDMTSVELQRLSQRGDLPIPLKVVTLPENQGYPKAINAGLKEARGEWIVQLNNDAVVPAHWLARLIHVAERAGSDCGLVGPVSNGAPPPQALESFPTLDQLDTFANARWHQTGPKASKVPRLTGFCMAVRRDVWDVLGGLDERFGLGFFDDDDLCLRARKAGYTLAIAEGVYVHHDGSQTFLSHGIDTQKLLQENLELYRDKWGDNEANRYRLATLPSHQQQLDTPVILPDVQVAKPQTPEESLPSASHIVSSHETPVQSRLKISLTMIVKNEERYLPECLESIKGLFDEVVIVDTGSTDRTKEIIKAHGAKLGEFAWVDSFSQARNAALDLATGDWIFWLDADDRILPSERPKLEVLLNRIRVGEVHKAQSIKCRCLPAPGGNPTVVDHVRLFPKRPGVRWEYRVHEQILPSLNRIGVGVDWSDVMVTHVGYAPPEAREGKMARDLRLLELSHQETPNEPFILFNLASNRFEMQQYQQALQYIQASLKVSRPQDSIVRKLFAMAAQCQIKLGDNSAALKTLQQGQRIYPADAEMLFTEGTLRIENRDFEGAITTYKKLLESKEAPHFGSVVEGFRGSKGKHNLAVAYWHTGQFAEAERLWKEALQEQPNFIPARRALSDVLFKRKDWVGLESLASQTETFGDEGKELAILWRGRVLLQQERFSEARAVLTAGTKEFPKSLDIHGMRAEACLKEGLDLAETERAFADFLKLDPNHSASRLQYAIVRAQRKLGLNFGTEVTLDALHNHAVRSTSEISSFLPVIAELARASPRITEMGTGTGESTVSLLSGNKTGHVTSYDHALHSEVELLSALGRQRFRFIQADLLNIEIEPCDFLFLDGLHDYDQLQQALKIHARKVKRFLAIHNTATYGEQGKTEGKRGLWPAIEEFVAEGKWIMLRRYTHINGLTVLERKT